MENCTGCGTHCRHGYCMRKVPIFSTLSERELAHIAPLVRHDAYRKGEVLLAQGDAPERLIILNEGSAKAFTETPDGREQILYVFAEGDFFGEHNLFARRALPYAVAALEPVQTCSFGKADLERMLHAHPDIAVKIIGELERRMARLETALQSMGVRSVDARLGVALLDFAGKYGTRTDGGTLLHLPLSREGLASYLGIARETLSRKLGQLETDGVVRAVGGRGLLLCDRTALEALAGVSDSF